MSFRVHREGDQKGTRTMQTMHSVICSACSEAWNHAGFGPEAGFWTPGGQGVG